MARATIRSLERAIAETKAEILRLGELRPGALSQQFNVCGKAGCRCKGTPPQRHGPYYQLSYTLKKKSTTRFVRKDDVERIQREIRCYAQLKQLVERWVNLATKLSDLKVRAKSQA